MDSKITEIYKNNNNIRKWLNQDLMQTRLWGDFPMTDIDSTAL